MRGPFLRGFDARFGLRSAYRTVHSCLSAHRTPLESAARSFQVKVGNEAQRLDVFLSEQQAGTRAKTAAWIKDGHVQVDGQIQTKSSYRVKLGQSVSCAIPPPKPVGVAPEAIPLNIVFEDDHLLVVNKPGGMVVHPAPGHLKSGTLVNALLHHWEQPPIVVETPFAGIEDMSEDDVLSHSLVSTYSHAVKALRPGIVHRLDKGTTGLLVVAKDDPTLAHLCDQFKSRTVHRRYTSILIGCPAASGSVATNIGRHFKERKLMAAYTFGSARGRPATSSFQIERALAGGGAAVASWKLGSGRTHQIRVHAKHIGHPLFGDDAYGGVGNAVASRIAGPSSARHFLEQLRPGRTSQVRLDRCLQKVIHYLPYQDCCLFLCAPADQSIWALTNVCQFRQAHVHALLAALGRPALHAIELGFQHPQSGHQLIFNADKPVDLSATEQALSAL